MLLFCDEATYLLLLVLTEFNPISHKQTGFLGLKGHYIGWTYMMYNTGTVDTFCNLLRPLTKHISCANNRSSEQHVNDLLCMNVLAL